MRGWFGISSLESLSQGKPVVAGLDDWNIRCIKEFTGAEKLPWVIARNVDELERRMEQLFLDRDFRETTGFTGRIFMEKQWNEDRVLEILLDIYKGA
jgi:hypothetical protein